MDGLFKNPESKLKILAKVIFVAGTVVSVVAALIFLISSLESGAAVTVLVCGPLASWAIGLLLYGFGELLEKSNYIEKQTKETTDTLKRSLKEKQPSSHVPTKDERVETAITLYSKGLLFDDEYKDFLDKINAEIAKEDAAFATPLQALSDLKAQKLAGSITEKEYDKKRDEIIGNL